jgi:hypothetical protein
MRGLGRKEFMDYGRQKDLEILSSEYQTARYRHDKDDIINAMNKIMRASVPIRMLREDLLKATMANDRVAVKKIIMHINKVRQDETYGREIS